MFKQETKDDESSRGPIENLTWKRGGDGGAGRSGTSVIGKGMSVTGDITATGEVRIDGEIEGSVRTKESLVIGRDGRIDGDIQAEDIVAGGRVKGSMNASKAVRLKSGCRVDADINSAAMELEEGGSVHGTIEIGGKNGKKMR